MSCIKFTINGKNFELSNSIAGNISLCLFIRNEANLFGTKIMCQEGGCGACIVAVKNKHPVTKKTQTFCVNSCLVSILSCHKWSITTIEGIGNKKVGYHDIQKRLAKYNGTQCGYCTPGMIMNMYSIYEKNKDNLTMKKVEDSFAGNICRCTGYRPILDAFKSYAKDAPSDETNNILDIEDLSHLDLCKRKTRNDSEEDIVTDEGFCLVNVDKNVCLKADNVHWYKVYTIKDIFDLFQTHSTDSYTLIAGNTGQGIYRRHLLPDISIDITGVSELRKYSIEANLVLGSTMTLNEVIDVLENVGNKDIYYKYLLQMRRHFDLIAHVPLRDIATIGGNLYLKYIHNDFPSDVFLLFETVNASLTIAEKFNKVVTVTLQEYLKMDMNRKVIIAVNMPPLTVNHILQSYKIMPRAQNAHAQVNAGFLFKFNENKTAIENVNIVYGGIRTNFIHAEKAEKFLIGKNIFDNDILKQTLETLNDEIDPECYPAEPTPEFRKQLAINLFYKCILQICPPNLVSYRNKSGGEEFIRPVSSGKQDFDTNRENWPINEPIPKVEALAQCSGEAKFVNDLPSFPYELYAAFVLSTVASGEIDNINIEKILKKEGIVAVFTAKDIPGSNNFTPIYPPIYNEIEEVLCSGKIKYHGQPVAILVAETSKLARLSAEEVEVTYKNVKSTPPVLTLREAIKDKGRVLPSGDVTAKKKGENVEKVIKGSMDMFGQYHYTLETLQCICIPTEDGMDVYSSSQWMDNTQIAIAQLLNIPENSINIRVKRIGGGYGLKISRSVLVATGCALAAYNLNKPVRFLLPMDTNMAVVGKRTPSSCDYEVGVDNNGLIQYLNCTYYEDNGCSHNENIATVSIRYFANCYNDETFTVHSNGVLTDTAANTWCRAPGTTETIAMIENIMEHIAVEVERDPLEVRMINLKSEDKNILDVIKHAKDISDFEVRQNKIKIFNSENKWKKRGINLCPMKLDLEYYGTWYSTISIYHADGTVSVTHGGIEMGQGVNTKVAQVCACILGIPLKMISIKASNNLTAPNSSISGGSVTSDCVCFATKKAAEIIMERLKPIKSLMNNPTWPELINRAFLSGVDLCAHYYHTPLDGLKNYYVYGATVIEVEVDLLTGNHQILRVDIVEDTGESLSPMIDVGQVEGAYVMGLGYWTCEHLEYDKKTGALLTNRTWNYKPPGVKDIPIDFRVYFRRNAPNEHGVLRSKATGEPPLNMAFGIIPAIRQAVMSLRKDIGFPTNEWFTLDLPATTANIIMATQTRLEDLTL